MRTLRTLGPDDATALEAFLAPQWQSSMFLRANARAAGLVDRGRLLEGTYVAAWQGDAIVSVVAHFWNGLLALQVPDAALLPSLVQAAVAAASGRRVSGFAGREAQVLQARAALGLLDATLLSREALFALTLSELRLPPRLADGTWHCRAPRPEERDLLAGWRAAYHVETSGRPADSDAERVRAQFQLDDVMRVLLVDGQPAALCTFIAQLPDVVQVGGVYTPPALRGRHYARAVVAGALRDAGARGVARALLFTGEDNAAAQRAYLAIGFAVVAEVTLALLA